MTRSCAERWAWFFGMSLLLASQTVRAFPDKPVRVIVPTGAGTTSDLLIRAMSSDMGRALGQPLVIENRPGANQIIGYEYVARQVPADGYTVVLAGLDGLALLPVTSRDLRFDPLKDLPAAIGIAEGRYVLRSPGSAPWKTFPEMVAYVKANPGKVNYGSSAAQVRFPILVLIRDLGLNMVHVPYAGGAKYLQGIAGAEIELGITGEASLSGMGDRVRTLAVTGVQRLASMRDVPTFNELNFQQIRGPSYSINVRAGTPREIIERLHASASRSLQSADVKAAIAKIPLEVLNDGPELSTRKLLDAAKFYSEFAKSADIRPE